MDPRGIEPRRLWCQNRARTIPDPQHIYHITPPP